MNPLELLQEVNRRFPLPPEDRRNHSLTLNRESGGLNIAIWIGERGHSLHLDPEDMIRTSGDVVDEIFNLIFQPEPPHSAA